MSGCRRRVGLALSAVVAVSGPVWAQAPAPDPRTAILVAGDARIGTPAQRATIDDALRADAPTTRTAALRAAARTQRAAYLPAAIAALAHPSIDVRREAAFAVAHIGAGNPETLTRATAALHEALGSERDAFVAAALAEEYGRLPFATDADLSAAARALAGLLTRLRADGATPALVELGVARGSEALARRAATRKEPAADLAALLVGLFETARVTPARPDTAVRARVRRLAVSGLSSLAVLTPSMADLAVADPDAQVRRLGVIAHTRLGAVPADRALTWLRDDAFLVRHAVASRVGPTQAAVAEAALHDAHLNVRLAAIDALGQAHACRARCLARLEDVAPAAPWHERAHALVALARTDPASARPFVARAAGAEPWQVRMYAARAAGITRQADVLARLAADAHVNVRHAALVAWRESALPGVHDAAVRALTSDDGQLVLEAAAALKGAPTDATTVTALRAALARLTASGRETSRDPRLALVERIADVDADRGATLAPYLSDFDPVLAARVAALVGGAAAPAVASAKAHVSVPTWEEVERLSQTTVRLTFTGGRSLTLRLYADQAPTAVARFVEQVRAGEWNGRTFHRVEPGFVIQGGSPAANEYAGAAAFTRDEFSPLSHVRGTIGISTRGPDTGDGQIFVNLVDNARLDFGFTLIGSITGDPSLIDDIVEGEVIEAAAAADAPRGPR